MLADLFQFAAAITLVALFALAISTVPLSIGTRSTLYGYHAFYLHWFFVARGWIRLYGWTWDPRHWIAFLVHDLGYFGKPNMDGVEGTTHPRLGAWIMSMFDTPDRQVAVRTKNWGRVIRFNHGTSDWHDFALFHSRHYAALLNRPVSLLCAADKLAITFYPKWLLKFLVESSGEIVEYKELAEAHDGVERTTEEWMEFICGHFHDAAYKLVAVNA